MMGAVNYIIINENNLVKTVVAQTVVAVLLTLALSIIKHCSENYISFGVVLITKLFLCTCDITS